MASASQAAHAFDNFPGETISGSGSISRSSVGATAQTGEPGPFTPINSMWYTWTAASAGTLVVQTCSAAGTNFDTTLSAYTGTAVNALTLLQQNDDTTGCAVSVNANYGSRLTLQVTQGTTYQIQMDGYAGATGTFLLQYAFTPAAITVTTTDASATEGADTATFTVALATQPTANTTVTINPDASGQCTFAPTTLTFTTANFATPQTVTVTAVNDVTPEGTHSCTTGAITASGSNYSTVTGTPPTFTVVDNDQGLQIVNTVPTATEGGATGAFTVRLTTVPTGNVTVTIAADATGQCTFAPTTLTFTPGTWNVVQTVTTTAVNDVIVEGTHSCSTGVIAASGGGYSVSGTAPTFSITDNDVGTIIVTNTVPTATEGGATGAFTVQLGLQPSATVTVTVAADTSGQCTFAPTSLTFTTANWNTAQTVTTTAVNDVVVEGPHSCTTGTILASGGSYTGVTGTAPTFTITDNDVGTIIVTNTTPTATEGGATGAFTVVLGLQPSGTVTVTVAADGSGQCTFAPTTLTFTSANWNTAQTVTTTAVDDVVVEGPHSCTTGTVSASGGGYTGVTGTAPMFTITDNDVGTITVTNTTPTATEGGATGGFTIVLTAQPATNVTVTIGPDSSGQCTFAPTPLTFTSANWNTAQTVTTTAVNDLVVEGAHSCTTGAISASGSGYTGVTGTAPTFTITDNDVGTITVTNTTPNATEGGATGAFTVVLGLQPSGTVSVTVAADGSGQCTFAPTTLTFTTANWSTAQTVTTTAVNDLVVEGTHSCTTGAISASGGSYTGVSGTAPTFTITDNDIGAIVVTNTTPTATEGGATGAFTVRLGLQPSGSVTVTVAADPSGQCAFAPTSLTFTTANWNTVQTVTTTAVNDLVVEGTHACTTGAISASGGSYTGVSGTAPTFTITDNDIGTIIVTNTVPTATEGGATGAFTVRLGLQPSGSVTVTVAADASGQCTFAPTTLTFTTANWNTVQSVTTTAVNDLIVEGTHSCTTGSISASGGSYAGVTGTAPTFTITDNDTGAITIVKTIGSATEGGATGAFTVVLTAQPATNVTITIGPDAAGQCTFAPTPLTFTNANWNTTQTVTTTAVNDLIVEGTHSCTTGTISASGSGYTGVTGASQTFTITDDDTASITVVKNSSVPSVTIAGNVINYTVQVSNTGTGAATGITVSDTLVPVTCPTSGNNTIASLAPATSETCTASYTVTQADFDNNGGGDGDIDNTASAIGASGGVAVFASGSRAVLCTQNPSLTLLKSANTSGPLTVGQIITYTFVATNNGNVTLSDVGISETAFNGTNPPLGTPLGETLTDNLPLNTPTEKSEDSVANDGVWTTLKPNDAVTFSINYTVMQTDVDLLQ